MSGGEISGNTATAIATSSYSSYYYSGGGVCVGSNGTFIKNGGGTIYGSDAGNDLKNTVTGNGYYGHAVYASTTRKRDTTANPGVNMASYNSGSPGGWE
jgi:hypothetical protein